MVQHSPEESQRAAAEPPNSCEKLQQTLMERKHEWSIRSAKWDHGLNCFKALGLCRVLWFGRSHRCGQLVLDPCTQRAV